MPGHNLLGQCSSVVSKILTKIVVNASASTTTASSTDSFSCSISANGTTSKTFIASSDTSDGNFIFSKLCCDCYNLDMTSIFEDTNSGSWSHSDSTGRADSGITALSVYFPVSFRLNSDTKKCEFYVDFQVCELNITPGCCFPNCLAGFIDWTPMENFIGSHSITINDSFVVGNCTGINSITFTITFS